MQETAEIQEDKQSFMEKAKKECRKQLRYKKISNLLCGKVKKNAGNS